MRIGVIGDDFTGSSDVANTLAKAGARTLQYIGTPRHPAQPDIDAAVISLKTRSIAADDAVAQSIAACRWLRANGAEQVVFKYCSTFDSTPQGNIGPVAAALLDELEAPLALVCPAFPANGRTVYQGHLFVWDKLLNESGMENHPLTPMTDPDIRRWLARQTELKVGHISLPTIRSHALGKAVAAAEAAGERLIVADAILDDDLLTLGRAAACHRLVTGGSGIAMALPGNFDMRPGSASGSFQGAPGPALVLSGSCSAATRRQVAIYREEHPSLELNAEALSKDGNDVVERSLAFIEKHKDAAPLVFSSADPAVVSAAQARYGASDLAGRFENFFASLATQAMVSGFRRIIVAGGETSGAVASALGQGPMRIGPEIDTGVPALVLDGPPRLSLALKSGNFGADDFFERALSMLEGGHR
ncbi:four-carbon acid sugar kinase family protein [Mesorhizobium sp. BH1-1-5]|uniref:3-oxo-tetronate kinase n=1 Tax=Mesorhizobium sp. BH1-1-5 TaxID=2876661 RepID=UPI001CCE4D42|nr:3-oxo-tetronate kinase [Mesorhizobium sp. BH1-1-5]MBZ9988872.1 four-carbon acid sugar kinase family protein [Mesorhizobium sp. BH1-1-5]